MWAQGNEKAGVVERGYQEVSKGMTTKTLTIWFDVDKQPLIFQVHESFTFQYPFSNLWSFFDSDGGQHAFNWDKVICVHVKAQKEEA